MRYNKESAKKRLEHVPIDKRVWIYNADIIIEFLNQTFMPTSYFLKDKGKHVTPGKQVAREQFVLPDDHDCKIEFDELYKYYLTFRNHKDYTSEIETKFKFGVILKKLRFYKNGWEFVKVRYGRRQTVVVYPLLLRVRTSEVDRNAYPIERNNVAKAQVDVEMADMKPDEDVAAEQPQQPQPVHDEPVEY